MSSSLPAEERAVINLVFVISWANPPDTPDLDIPEVKSAGVQSSFEPSLGSVKFPEDEETELKTN